METRLQAYRLALDPPSLLAPPRPAPPPPETPQPKTIPANPLKKLLPLYFLALHTHDKKNQEYLLEIEKNTQDLNPRILATDCFSQFKDLTLSDFENLFAPIAEVAAPLKKRIAPYLIELLWEKLAQLDLEEINKHVAGKQQVATPIKQTYQAFRLLQAKEQAIHEEKDPFTIALAIALPKNHPRKILNEALETLLKSKTSEREHLIQIYQQNLQNLPSSSTSLTQKRRAAYQLLCKTLSEIKK